MRALLPAATADKHRTRTITLTNRAPIKIAEDDWPVIAQGGCGHETIEWEIAVRVRRENKPPGRYVIYANYRFDNPDSDEPKRVRVGRLLEGQLPAPDLWKHILAVGQELQDRIGCEHLRKYVTYALDSCFANLKAHDE